MNAEILVKCIDCGDIWHTTQQRGEYEVCAPCDSYFSIEEENVVSGEDYKIMLQRALRREEEN